MENGKLVRKNVAAGRRLRPLRHTRQMSAQPRDDEINRKDKLDGIDAYISHVSLENNTSDNHTALHSALQSLKGRVHHARAQSVKRSESKPRQGNNINNITNTSFASTAPKMCTPTESVMPPKSIKHRLHKTNSTTRSTDTNEVNMKNNSSNMVTKEYLSASMPLHYTSNDNNNSNNSNNQKAMSSVKLRSNSKHVSVHAKECSAWDDKTSNDNTKMVCEQNSTKEKKENTTAVTTTHMKTMANTNKACHHKRSTPAVMALQKRKSIPQTNMLHVSNQNTNHARQEELEEQEEKEHEQEWEQYDKSDSEASVTLPLAPNDMNEEYYKNKANWETDLPWHVKQLLEGKEWVQEEKQHEKKNKKEEEQCEHNTYENKHKGGYFACIRCHTPICAPCNQTTLPQTPSPLLTSWNNNYHNHSSSMNTNKESHLVAFRCIDHHAITIALKTVINDSGTSRFNGNSNRKKIEGKTINNEELHFMVHCVHCHGCLGELTSVYHDSSSEWEMGEMSYVYVAHRACLKYMPFRTEQKLNTPVDLMLCCDDDSNNDGLQRKEDEEDKNNVSQTKHKKRCKTTKKSKEAIDVEDDELFQLSWHSSDLERDVFNSFDDDNPYM